MFSERLFKNTDYKEHRNVAVLHRPSDSTYGGDCVRVGKNLTMLLDFCGHGHASRNKTLYAQGMSRILNHEDDLTRIVGSINTALLASNTTMLDKRAAAISAGEKCLEAEVSAAFAAVQETRNSV